MLLERSTPAARKEAARQAMKTFSFLFGATESAKKSYNASSALQRADTLNPPI
jgi:hypothetical protein